MGSLKKIKKEDSLLSTTLADLLSFLDTTKTKKVLPVLGRIVKNKQNNYNDFISSPPQLLEIENSIVRTITYWLNYHIMCDGNEERFYCLMDFIDYSKNNKLVGIDFNEIKTIEQIESIVSEVKIKESAKKVSKKTQIIYDDGEWLFLKPLSFESSLVYGAGTKWCTASRNNPSYFHRYSRDGILVYVINKKTGVKVGIHSSFEGLSFWDVVDNRIDSIQSGIPNNILLSVLPKIIKTPENQCNYHYFHDSDKEQELFLKETIDIAEPLMPQEEMIIENYPQDETI
jgi:hypothetical protein